MPTPIEVEDQRFLFGDRWTVAFKYDDTDFYRKGPERLKGELTERTGDQLKVIPQGTKGVDVIALHPHFGLLLLEAKDFRGYRIENKHRINRGEVAIETALKVRDTVSALIGAARHFVTEFPAQEIVAALNAKESVTAVLWLEDDTFKTPEETKAKLNQLNQQLKQKLAWLQVKTFVQSSRAAVIVPELSVSNRAGAGQPQP